MIFVFAAVAIYFWDTAAIYPVKVFVVFLHEISHGVAALLTGGKIIQIEVSQQIGGLCRTMGGSRFVVVSAGYLGSIIWGGLILILATRTRFSSIGSFILGLILLVITALYVRNSFGVIFGICTGIAFIIIAKYAPMIVNKLVLQFFGLVSCLYVLVDIKEDLFSLERRQTDAQLLADMTHIPSIIWAVLWMAVAILVLWKVLKYSHPDEPAPEKLT